MPPTAALGAALLKGLVMSSGVMPPTMQKHQISTFFVRCGTIQGRQTRPFSLEMRARIVGIITIYGKRQNWRARNLIPRQGGNSRTSVWRVSSMDKKEMIS